MEIRRIDEFLSLDNAPVDGHCGFRTGRWLDRDTEAAKIKIRRESFEGLAPGCSARIGLALNGGDETLIFEGAVERIVSAGDYLHLEAVSSPLDKKKPRDETFQGLSLREVLEKFVPRLEYRGEEVYPGQVVLRGTGSENFFRLMEALKRTHPHFHHWLGRGGVLHVADRLEGPCIYEAEPLLLAMEGSEVSLFAIPELEIGDLLELGTKRCRVRSLSFEGAAVFCATEVLED